MDLDGALFGWIFWQKYIDNTSKIQRYGVCVKHVDKALRDIQGIKDVDVSLESKSAQVQLDQDVPDAVLKAAIEDAGYQLVSIQ